MSIRTVLISRNLSAKDGKPNGRAVGNVLQICDGDKTSEWDALSEMVNKFYWKTVNLTDKQVMDINEAIAPPIIEAPKKTVALDCFSAKEKTDLSKKGSIVSGKGGSIQNSNFIISEV